MSNRKRPLQSQLSPQLQHKRQRTSDHKTLLQTQEIVLCSHCGDQIVKNPETVVDRAYHKDCKEKHLPKCKGAAAILREKYVPAERLLCMGINVDFLYGTKEGKHDDKKQDKEEKRTKQEKRMKRDNKIKELLKNASALRNSDSGVILIQLVGLSPDDSFTGAFDEFADYRLNDLIEDGSMFGEVYKKVRLSKLEFSGVDMKRYYDFLVLYVGGSSVITTSDFATKVSLDHGIIDPSPAVMIKFLKGKKLLVDNLLKADTSDLTKLQKSREIQLKGVGNLTESEQSNLAEHVWTKLRLRDYICAFSKNVLGGSYFLGIGETHSQLSNCNYTTTVNDVHGLSHSINDDLKKQILDKVKNKILVCNFDGDKLCDEFVSLDSLMTGIEGKYVLKISVKPVKGIVFHDQQGPLAYKVAETEDSSEIEDSVVQVTLDEWFQGVSLTF